jgi:hypothetical protein
MNRVPQWFVTLIAVFAPVAIAQATKEVTIREPGKYGLAGDKASGFGVQYLVGPRATLMPKGAFLLIRRGKSIGAVRFTSIELSSEVGVGKATYESYFQKDIARSLLDQGVVRKTGLIDLRALVGVGHLAFQRGQDRVEVGPWSFGCSHPGLPNMWPYRGESKNYGYEFAPTSAQNVAEIDFSDKRLQWFKFDPEASITLRLSELPK